MTDQADVREFLHRMANEAGFAPVEPGPVVRKARRRLARTVGGTLLMAGALVAGALVAANGLMNAARTQMPQPAGQPTPTTTENGEALGEFTERFDSPLHGLSIGYPSGWRTRAATEPWGHGEVAFGAPDVDVIFHPTLRDDLYFALVSEPLGGKSGSDWVNDVVGNLSSVGICEGPGGFGGGDDRLDGNYGWFFGCDTPFGSYSVAIIATATRGYIIYLHVGDEVPATYPVPRFEPPPKCFSNTSFCPTTSSSALQTLDLRPEEAPDALNPSESP